MRVTKRACASFEQILNARYLESLGYGLSAEPITGERLGEFLERLPEFERKLGGYAQDGNRDLLGKLDEVLHAAARGGPPPDLEDPNIL